MYLNRIIGVEHIHDFLVTFRAGNGWDHFLGSFLWRSSTRACNASVRLGGELSGRRALRIHAHSFHWGQQEVGPFAVGLLRHLRFVPPAVAGGLSGLEQACLAKSRPGVSCGTMHVHCRLRLLRAGGTVRARSPT
jgi:hypothetical protein